MQMTDEMKPRQGGPVDDDLVLVDRSLAGDRQAFEALVRKHERRIFRVAVAVLGNTEDAEEAMQDTFVKAYRHLSQFRKDSRFTTWLTRIAINEALQKRASRKDHLSLDDTTAMMHPGYVPRELGRWQEDPEKSYGKEETRLVVEAAVRSLPTIYREALILRDIEGMSAEEAAAALAVSIPALKSRLLRARLMLRDGLAAKFRKPATVSSAIVDTGYRIRDAIMMRMMRMTRNRQ
jgi:RNA polymerase sigma-70 factor, ECF subfamily